MNKKNRRKFLLATAGITASLSGCTDVIQSRETTDTTASTPAEESATPTNTPTETPQSGGLQGTKISEKPEDLSFETWKVTNTGSSRILAANAVRVRELFEAPGLLLSPHLGDDSKFWQFGLGPGKSFRYEGFGPSRGEGVQAVYTPEDIPLTPTTQADIMVSPDRWTTPSSSTGSNLIFEFENPTSVNMSDVRDISPRSVSHQDGETLRWTYPEGPYWTGSVNVTLSTTTESTSFTIGVPTAPKYDINVTKLTEDGRVEFNVSAENELGTWDAHALLFGWEGLYESSATDSGGLLSVDRIQQTPTGPDDMQGAIVTPEVGTDRVGKSANYTSDIPELSFPVGEDASVGVLIMINKTPVSYASTKVTSLV